MTPADRRILAAAAAPIVAAAVSSHVVCDLLFGCGCVLGSMAHCTIHHPGRGPACPWCAGRVLFPLALFSWTAAGAAAARLARGRGPLAAGAASAAGVLAAILASGAFTIAVTDYPTLLGFSLRGSADR